MTRWKLDVDPRSEVVWKKKGLQSVNRCHCRRCQVRYIIFFSIGNAQGSRGPHRSGGTPSPLPIATCCCPKPRCDHHHCMAWSDWPAGDGDAEDKCMHHSSAPKVYISRRMPPRWRDAINRKWLSIVMSIANLKGQMLPWTTHCFWCLFFRIVNAQCFPYRSD